MLWLDTNTTSIWFYFVELLMSCTCYRCLVLLLWYSSIVIAIIVINSIFINTVHIILIFLVHNNALFRPNAINNISSFINNPPKLITLNFPNFKHNFLPDCSYIITICNIFLSIYYCKLLYESENIINLYLLSGNVRIMSLSVSQILWNLDVGMMMKMMSVIYMRIRDFLGNSARLIIDLIHDRILRVQNYMIDISALMSI